MLSPLAYIHPSARLAAGVTVEPFTTIAADVEIGEGTWIGPNVTIMNGARIGANCQVFQSLPRRTEMAGQGRKGRSAPRLQHDDAGAQAFL